MSKKRRFKTRANKSAEVGRAGMTTLRGSLSNLSARATELELRRCKRPHDDAATPSIQRLIPCSLGRCRVPHTRDGAAYRRGLAGGAAFGMVCLGIIALGEKAGWWHMAITWKPYFLRSFSSVSSSRVAPVYLITWRIDRRFGWRGLAVAAVVAAAIGPPRLLVHGEVPRMGRLRARDRARPGDRRDLRHHGDPGALGDAAWSPVPPTDPDWPDGHGRPPSEPLHLVCAAVSVRRGTSLLRRVGATVSSFTSSPEASAGDRPPYRRSLL